MEADGPPRFLGNPFCCVPPSLTPVGGRTLAQSRPTLLPSPMRRGSAPTNTLNFEAQSRGPLTRCLRFGMEVARHPARLATGLLAKLLPDRTQTCWVSL